MEKMEAPSQSPKELPMSLITVMNVTLGMLRVTWILSLSSTIGEAFHHLCSGLEVEVDHVPRKRGPTGGGSARNCCF